MERIHRYIGGKAVASESGRRGDVFNPATGEKTHEVDFAGRAEVEPTRVAARR
jgi:malonate-semialdehyde dehydrogenase (acetylating)/methylmalonate-semialdehyde dehydrogenase